MPSVRDRFQRWPRPWRIAVIVLLALYALYLLAGNVFLNTPLFDATTNRQPHKFSMQTGPALTLVPGQVMAWNVRMRGQANRTVYVFHADRAHARIALLALFRREVRLPWLHAVNVSAEVDTSETPIPPPPRGNRGWTLRFDAISSDSIRSARLGKLLIAGHGHGTVGFLKQLKGGPSELFPSEAGFSDAVVSYDGVQVFNGAQVDAQFQFPRHYRDRAPGLRKFGITRARLQIKANTAALKIDTGAPNVDIRSGPSAARVEADIALANGALQPGSRAVWRLPLLAGVGATDRGMLALQLDVAQDIRVQARLPRDADTGSELHADLRIAGRSIPFQQPAQLLPRLSGQVRGRWQFESLNWIAELFVRKPWFQLEGGGLLEADLRLAQGRLTGGSRLDIPRVEAVAQVFDARLAGIANAHGRIDEAATPQAQLDVRIPTFKASAQDAPGQVLLDGRDLRLAMHGDAELARLRDTLKAQLRFSDAQVPELTVYNRYLPGRNVRLLGGRGSLSGDVALNASGDVGSGHAHLRGQGAHLALAGVQMRGDAELQAQLQRADFRNKFFDLSGTRIRLRNMQVGEDAADAGWWGELQVGAGTIQARAPFQLDAQAALRMRDAAPLLSVFAQRTDYPRWVVGLLDSGELEATGRLRWRKQQLTVDALHAENARLSLRARLAIQDEQRRGDLYLRWGVLGAGIELDGKQRQWHLAGAREWYEARPGLLPPVSGSQ
ncbi:hypothetical protein JWH11_08955 [Xanthomonas melonis]|uniref:DUF3971 domain-containing protein n=1 Tax=Xanthomonas melonis TaxID=56456 RepID=A0ABS8NU13_9XANT|nr:hypothetical protein [Xanthomonas melonis]MCD0245641.1 hypothetical protein [Xanthomonas melonis]MCD0258303.1 hypothetical protein [Xanthomonas melonis]MCD0266565.1 hypothetical protein [Xanthomonas melonis]MCD0279972.1 hypothetical protein [Xanthomonas melonis]